MTHTPTHTTTTETTSWRPAFVHEIKDRAEADGLLQATHDLLERDNITVDATGHQEAVAAHQGGLLFVGNHNKQFEFVALMAYLSRIGRTSMKNIVKFYVEDQVRWALGPVGTDIVLPVYPRLLASDRTNIFNAELGSRILSRTSLKTTAESSRLNAQTLAAATDELSDGGAVNIFPCGSICNNMRRPWRAGVGRIVTHLPEQDRADVLVVPYHAENISRPRMLAAVAMRGAGLFGRTQQVDIAFGHPRTVADVFAGVTEQQQADPVVITEALRQHYSAAF